MHRHTNIVGWAASGLAGVGAAVSSATQGLETTLINGVVTAAIGACTMVVGRLLWDLVGRITARWKPQPIDCPAAETCPYLHPPRASSHDLSADARITKPEKD